MLSLFCLFIVIYFQYYYLLPFVIVFIALSCIFLSKKKDLSVKNIALLPSGQLFIGSNKDENESEFLLKPNSRIGWFGCWVIYQDREQLNQSKQLLIFKDQLTRQDYCRLSRWILRYTQVHHE